MKRIVLFVFLTLIQLAETAEAAGPANEARETVQIARTSDPQAQARSGAEIGAIEAP